MSAAKRKTGRAPRITKARLAEMIEEATVDAYGESEQVTGWFTMIDEHLAVPFDLPAQPRAAVPSDPRSAPATGPP